jgi:hypothetical protein
MRFRSPSGANRAFTLLEVSIAIFIAMLILGVGVLSLRGIDHEAKIRVVSRELAANARSAMRDSLLRRETICIEFSADGFAGPGRAGRSPWRPLPKGGRLEIRRWGETRWREPRQGEVWWFRPGQPCEPIALRLTLREGRQEMVFDPLTASVLEERISVNPQRG